MPLSPRNSRAARSKPRDRALARLIAATVLRRLGELEAVLNSYLEKPLPSDRARCGQSCCPAPRSFCFSKRRRTLPWASLSIRRDATGMQPATTSSSMRCCGAWRARARRRCRCLGRRGAQRSGMAAAALDATLTAPTRRAASRRLRSPRRRSTSASRMHPQAWAERLGGHVLPTGSVRLAAGGRIEDLPGYSDGAWWVQDAAAALPVRLLGSVAGKSVVDLCAAPGGKTAQLAAAGARRYGRRPCRRAAEAAAAPISTACSSRRSSSKPTRRHGRRARTFDAVLLDAPCTSTGTIRRHPDILRLKRADDVVALAERAVAPARQRRPPCRARAARCSTARARSSPRKAPAQIERFLQRHTMHLRARRSPRASVELLPNG